MMEVLLAAFDYLVKDAAEVRLQVIAGRPNSLRDPCFEGRIMEY
jgi:hypothetical protein